MAEIPAWVREYAERRPQMPIAGGWLIRYVRNFDRVDRIVYCPDLHTLAMHMSEPYRRAEPQGADRAE